MLEENKFYKLNEDRILCSKLEEKSAKFIMRSKDPDLKRVSVLTIPLETIFEENNILRISNLTGESSSVNYFPLDEGYEELNRKYEEALK